MFSDVSYSSKIIPFAVPVDTRKAMDNDNMSSFILYELVHTLSDKKIYELFSGKSETRLISEIYDSERTVDERHILNGRPCGHGSLRLRVRVIDERRRRVHE